VDEIKFFFEIFPKKNHMFSECGGEGEEEMFINSGSGFEEA
jgi:hypothetical protein